MNTNPLVDYGGQGSRWVEGHRCLSKALGDTRKDRDGERGRGCVMIEEGVLEGEKEHVPLLGMDLVN